MDGKETPKKNIKALLLNLKVFVNIIIANIPVKLLFRLEGRENIREYKSEQWMQEISVMKN